MEVPDFSGFVNKTKQIKLDFIKKPLDILANMKRLKSLKGKSFFFKNTHLTKLIAIVANSTYIEQLIHEELLKMATENVCEKIHQIKTDEVEIEPSLVFTGQVRSLIENTNKLFPQVSVTAKDYENFMYYVIKYSQDTNSIKKMMGDLLYNKIVQNQVFYQQIFSINSHYAIDRAYKELELSPKNLDLHEEDSQSTTA
jgi:hypothetical protein